MSTKDEDKADDGAMSKPSRRGFMMGMISAGVLSASQSARGDAEGDRTFDFIVVGSGPGGGPVAANLAKAGFTVALIEAGLDPLGEQAESIDPTTDTIYKTPGFLAAAEEHPLLSWDFFVEHYGDPEKQAQDWKRVPDKGVLYPRGSTVGGSAAHNVMLFAYPHDEDFDYIARLTGDRSWRGANMRRYFQRLERCEYLERGAPGHGFDGYMPSTLIDEQVFDLYPALNDLAQAGSSLPSSYTQGNAERDLNHPLVAKGDTGSFRAPMHVSANVRIALREYLKATQDAYPGKLTIITGALATRVLFNRKKAAVGVEYMVGHTLYEAHQDYDPSVEPATKRIRARKEVILSGGVFNTPQLLKLSGVGPREELEALGIEVVADRPGVGTNLQDRYELTVVSELSEDLDLYGRCLPFQPSDPCQTALEEGTWEPQPPAPFYGPYANNAVYATRIAKSHPSVALPDLFLVGFAIPFTGFRPGFSNVVVGKHWTWLVVKCHNQNHAGTVTLRSTNPREMPLVNFSYFSEGNDGAGRDLDAVVEGVKMVRSFASHPQAAPRIAREIYPGEAVQTDAQIRETVAKEAWGHHASCSAPIGADHDPKAVLDGEFRVRGVKRLRVVDASAFPRIPGFFPVAAILMISEKASDAILRDCFHGRLSDQSEDDLENLPDCVVDFL